MLVMRAAALAALVLVLAGCGSAASQTTSSLTTDAAFVIIDAESGRLLGAIGVHRFGGEDGGPEVGYWLEREARGRGVATRALRLVVDWACRELGVRLLLQADVRNAASRRVAEKAQFQFVREAEAPHGCGDCETMAVYELTP